MAKSNAELQIAERDKGRLAQAMRSRLWHTCALFCCPEKSEAALNLAQSALPGGHRPEPQRRNDAAVNSRKTFSGGLKSWVCPGPASGWWGWEPSNILANVGQDTAELRDWLSECVKRADQEMDRGGFYTAAHQVFDDLAVIGTGCLYIDTTNPETISFKALSPTEFVFTVDFDNKPNGVRVTYHRSADQLIKLFGKENVPDSVRQDVASNKGDTTHEIIHAVYERPKEEQEEGEDYTGNPAKMPYASSWIHVGKKIEMRKGGYEEMPFVIPRWRLPTGTDGLYGVSPAMDALASARGVNLMDMLTATQVEVALNPRIKAPPGTGAIDLSPGGVTHVSGTGEGPTEWLSDGTRGGLQASDAFVVRKERDIARAFHADLFEMLTPIVSQRELTNGVAEMLQRESVSRISPAMGMLVQEFINPSMHRIFMECRRRGSFSQPPDSAWFQDTIGRYYFVFPKVAQTSRMSQALNSRNAFAYRSAMDRVLPLAEIKPELLDIYNFEEIHRDLDRGDGMPKKWHLDEEEVAQLREMRAKAQQAAQAQALIGEMAVKQPEALGQVAGMLGGQAA